MANTCAGCGKTIEWEAIPLPNGNVLARWVHRSTEVVARGVPGQTSGWAPIPSHVIEANGRLVGDQDHFTSSDEVPSIDFLSPMHQDLFDSV